MARMGWHNWAIVLALLLTFYAATLQAFEYDDKGRPLFPCSFFTQNNPFRRHFVFERLDVTRRNSKRVPFEREGGICLRRNAWGHMF